MRKTTFKIILPSVTVIVIGLWLISRLVPARPPADSAAAIGQATIKPTAFFPGTPLLARAALVYDAATNRALFAKAPNQPLPIASLTKLMTALVVDEWLPAAAPIVFRETIWTAAALSDFMLLTSDNDAAAALVAAAERRSGRDFVVEMNRWARRLGLTETRFANATGLDLDLNRPGAIGSAADMVRLSRYLLANHQVLSETKRSQLALVGGGNNGAGGDQWVKNTNEFIDRLVDPLASKTGLTPLAGGNLIVSFDRGLGQPVIVVALGSTAEGRFRDVSALTIATKKYFAKFADTGYSYNQIDPL